MWFSGSLDSMMIKKEIFFFRNIFVFLVLSLHHFLEDDSFKEQLDQTGYVSHLVLCITTNEKRSNMPVITGMFDRCITTNENRSNIPVIHPLKWDGTPVFCLLGVVLVTTRPYQQRPLINKV